MPSAPVPYLYELVVHFDDGDSRLSIRADNEDHAEAIGRDLFPNCDLAVALRQLPDRGWIGE